MRLIKLFLSVIFLFGIAFNANAVTIKWLGLAQDDSAHKEDIDAAIADWEAKTGHEIKWQYMAGPDLKLKLPTMLQSDDAPHLFYSWGGGVMFDQADAGFLQDISALVPDSYLENLSPAAADAFTYKGERVGLPNLFNQVVFWYNKDLTEKAGVDPSKVVMWNDLLEVVKDIKDAGITPICVGGKNKWPIHFYWTLLHVRNGGKAAFFDALENGGWDREEYIKSGYEFQQLVDLDPFQDGFMAVEYGDASAAFGNGQCALHLMGSWDYNGAKRRSTSGEGIPDDRMGTFQFPMTENGKGNPSDTLGGINGWLVSKNAPKEAVDFLMHYISMKYQSMGAKSGAYMPIYKGAETEMGNRFFKQQALNVANSTFHSIFWDQYLGRDIGEVVNDVSVELATKDITPEEATQRVQEAWEFNQ